MRARRRAGLACALLAASAGAGRAAAVPGSTLVTSGLSEKAESPLVAADAAAAAAGQGAPLPRAAAAPAPSLSPAQAAEAAALGLRGQDAAAFFGMEPVPQVADPAPVAERPPLVYPMLPNGYADAAAQPKVPPTPTPTPTDAPPLACALTVSADLPPGGAAVPACSPVTVHATASLPGGLPAGAPPLDGFITFATDGIAATAPLRLEPGASADAASVSATVTRWRVHPAGKGGAPTGGAALTAWYSPAGGNTSACVAGSSSPLAVPVARSTPAVSVSPNPAALAKADNATCDLKDLHARVAVAAAGGVTDCATPTGLVTLHVVRGNVSAVHAANLLPALSQATKAKVAQVAAAEVTAAALKAGHAAASRGSWKAAAAAGVDGAREEAVLLALDGAAGLGGGGGTEEDAGNGGGGGGDGPSRADHAAAIASGGGGGHTGLLDRARAALPALPRLPFGRRRLAGALKEAIDSSAFAHRKVGAGVLLPTQLLPGQPGHALIVPASGVAVGPRLLPGREYTLVAQYSGDDNFDKAAGVGALVVDGSCPFA